ncbi:MAG: serine/threonine protein kinase, partial [Deltaproteobacteria bacterium]|nr:serine/threonine protein kinase [Deltaproteobacteria bacterium]
MPASPPLGPSVAGESLGPYRLVRPISAGGMARVYEGRFESLAGVSTRVAIKVIHPDYAAEAGFQDLFIQEARISARLEHLNLVRVQQFNREGDLYFLVMEYIEGVTFRKIISACRAGVVTLDAELLAELGRQVCDGLAYAHSLVGDHGEPLHLVHRDMKPSNMMLNSQGVAKLLDFGISYAHGSEESSGAVKGTWGYMAPEQAAGAPVGPAADLFGLAAVMYELAAIAPLFPEEDNATIRRLLADDEAARRAARLGSEWTELGGHLVRALQRDPAARFRSAAAMGRAL